jgi:hypothetical protein
MSIAEGRGRRPAPAALCSLALCALLLCGCGGGGSHGAGTPVATVAGRAITSADLAHWTDVYEHEGTTARAVARAAAQQHALGFLILARWLQAEAAVRHIDVSEAEVRSTYQALAAALPPGLFAAGLHRRGLSEADELYRVRLTRLLLRMRASVLSGLTSSPRDAPARQRALRAFATAFTARWRQLTHCRAGYVIAQCANGPPLTPVEL